MEEQLGQGPDASKNDHEDDKTVAESGPIGVAPAAAQDSEAVLEGGRFDTVKPDNKTKFA